MALPEVERSIAALVQEIDDVGDPAGTLMIPLKSTTSESSSEIQEALRLPKPNVFRRLLSTALAGMNLRSRLSSVAWPPAGWRIRYGPLIAARIFSATASADGAVLIWACTALMVASACVA